MTSPPAPTPRDRTPLEHLVHDHQVFVWRYLRFLGCDAGEADDLTQDTFLAVVDRPVHRFGSQGARAYLRRVARNAFLKRRQQQRRVPAAGDLDLSEAAFEWARGDDDGADALGALRECLALLATTARRALTLRYGERLDRSAIAARLGLSDHGVKSLLQRSYARLRVCIERRLRDAT